MRHTISILLENAAGALSRVAGLSDIYGGRIVDVTDSSYIIELTGDGAKLDAFIDTVSTKRVLEVVRSGALGILRGTKALRA